ncbi:4724_t:CDS:2, partial [Gigaspora rosea]
NGQESKSEENKPKKLKTIQLRDISNWVTRTPSGPSLTLDPQYIAGSIEKKKTDRTKRPSETEARKRLEHKDSLNRNLDSK